MVLYTELVFFICCEKKTSGILKLVIERFVCIDISQKGGFKPMRKLFSVLVLIGLLVLSGCSDNSDKATQPLNLKIDALKTQVKSLEEKISELENAKPVDWVGSFVSVEKINPDTDGTVYIYTIKIFQGDNYVYLHSKDEVDVDLGKRYLIEYDKEGTLIKATEQTN